jgi:hypothetical protein
MVDPTANMQVDKASLQSFATVLSLTTALSSSPAVSEDPATLPTVTGPRSPVNSHRSSVIVQRAGAASCSFPAAAVDVAALPTVTSHQSVAPEAEPVAPSVDSFEKLPVDFPLVVNSSKILPRWPSGDVE